ncbi:MAG TPA: hypothetical protein VJL29_01810 [Thermoguttaceae bacterium]|nr:hypothetical protein [Thermoguttaceae bacterium]
MSCPFASTTRNPRLPSRLAVVGLVLLLGLSTAGCGGLNLRGEPFPTTDQTFQWSGRLRPPDKDVESFGFSNKARQIEGDFGAR